MSYRGKSVTFGTVQFYNFENARDLKYDLLSFQKLKTFFMKKGWSSENVETFFYEQRNDFINKRMIFRTFKNFFFE